MQRANAAENVSEIIVLGRQRLKLYNKNELERKFASTVDALLSQIMVALSTRNEIVHRVWVESKDGVHSGWKPIRSKQETLKGQPDWSSFSNDGLLELITDLGKLIMRAENTIADAGSIPRRAK